MRARYVGDGMTMEEIGDVSGVFYTTVEYWLDKHGIEREFDYRSAEWLEEQYHGEGREAAEIAESCEVDKSTVYWWMRKLGVETKGKRGKRNPSWRGGRVTKACVVCGDGYEVARCEVGSRSTCGDGECWSELMSEKLSGEDSPNWKGGYEDYYGPSWKRQRRRALRRDQHRCQRCRTTAAEIGQEPDVHHIIPFRIFGVDRHRVANRLANLISLCRQCHFTIEYQFSPVVA